MSMTRKMKIGRPMDMKPMAMRGGTGAVRRGAKTTNRQKRVKETATGTMNQTYNNANSNDEI